MSRTPKVVEAAVAAIMSAQLTPTEHLLLKDLVANAVDADQVARYILELIEQNSDQSTENVLRSLTGTGACWLLNVGYPSQHEKS
jgi:hypothetical protein